MERTDELKERIRQQPLNDRLEESRRRIGDMCSKGRCPKMTIPVQYDDDDFYINTTLSDAQAIIAALQSEVKDLKEWLAAYKQSLELAQSSLTQRTAERDTARRRVDELEAREVDVVLLREDLEQRTAELEAANDKVQFLEKKNRNLLDSENLTLKVKADQDVRLASLQAELERVRGGAGQVAK